MTDARRRHGLVPDDLALSRAGAMAVVWSRALTLPALPFAGRVALLLAGSVAIAQGVAGLLWTGLGPGPLDVLITAVSGRWSIPITFVVWGVAAFMMAAAWVLGRRPGAGTLVLPLVSGALLPWCIRLLDSGRRRRESRRPACSLTSSPSPRSAWGPAS